MRLNLERTRELFFWLVLLALPLQTRWFQEGSSLGDYPWEQGRISIYASWVFVVICILLRLYKTFSIKFRRPCEGQDLSPNVISSEVETRPRRVREYAQISVPTLTRDKRILRFLGLLLLFPVFLHTSSPRAAIQFSLEWIVLGLFVWSALDLPITRKKISLGHALSLLPAVLFGLWQYWKQHIPGIKYFGIAAQHPLTRGVSVIDVGGERVLRVYGTFPHPNIFAGWLVVAIILLVLSLPCFLKRWQQWSVIALINLFLITLLLTFSRAALIALLIAAITGLLVTSIRRSFLSLPKRRMILFMLLTTLIVGGTFWQTRSLWFVRVQSSTRLEQRSVDERTQALRDGVQIFRESPWLGVGPGAELLAVQKLHPSAQTPPVPPHLVWLVILNELGLIGTIGVLFVLHPLIFVVLAKARTHPLTRSLLFPLSVALFVLSLFDHYLWTLWSGKTLVMVAVLAFFFIHRTLEVEA